jgi:outer membrane protein assembly factor BamB
VYALEYTYSDFGNTQAFQLSAFDLVACRTSTLSCSPLWTASLDAMPQGLAVANGLVYLSTLDDRRIAAYDATGTNGCSGSPVVCTPVWETTISGAPTAPIIANGVVYAGSRDDNVLHAYKLP